MRDLVEFGAWAEKWLFDSALPLWWKHGADHFEGGYYDSLSPVAAPQGKPDRLRVQTRQLYVYSQAGKLGWSGPWLAATRHAAATLSLFLRPDGFYGSRLSSTGGAVDLYDQSFVVFALAHLYAAEGGSPRALSAAEALVEKLRKSFRCADGAYWDRFPTDGAARKSNPLMHLLEAALAWRDLGYKGAFAALADELSEFALAKLTQVGCRVGEDFDFDWKSTADCRYEPGHQFEWCYLLHKAGAGTAGVWDGLYQIGASDTGVHGVPFSTDVEGRVTEGRYRLWAQTERLRTAVYFYSRPASPVILTSSDVGCSVSVVQRLLEHSVPGLWHEWQDEQGNVIPSACPATSLYHIMTAFSTLIEAAVDKKASGSSALMPSVDSKCWSSLP
jgi:mannose/cellobiose epimerase-like protein (N-acyl-D-glucosamine 2-epimerase family)